MYSQLGSVIYIINDKDTLFGGVSLSRNGYLLLLEVKLDHCLEFIILKISEVSRLRVTFTVTH